MVIEYYQNNNYMVGKLATGEEFIFDIEDYEFIKSKQWICSSHNRIVTTYGQSLSMLLLKEHNMINYKRRILHINHNPFDFRKKNLFNGNRYVFYDTYVEGVCFDGQIFKIDIEDFDLISTYVWHVDKNHYVITKHKGKVYKQHRMVLNLCDENANIEVDHINHDTLDNRKNELRIANRSENCINRTLSKHNKSGITGIYWCNSANKWAVQISKDKVKHYLGVYADLTEAIAIRKQAEQLYHKEFTCNK